MFRLAAFRPQRSPRPLTSLAHHGIYHVNLGNPFSQAHGANNNNSLKHVEMAEEKSLPMRKMSSRVSEEPKASWLSKVLKLRREPPMGRKTTRKSYVWSFPIGYRIVDEVVEDKGLMRDRISYWIYKNPWKSSLLLLVACAVAIVKAINLWFDPAEHLPSSIISTIRVVRSFWALAKIIWLYKWNLWLVDEKQEEEVKRQCNKHSAKILLQLCLANGGLFIKAGQHIASLNNILPEEYCTTLQPCQDQAIRRPWKEMKHMFEEEFGNPIEAFFSEFNIDPIAAASLAQVYKGRLHDGTEVAVKMQYPKLQESSASDAKVMRYLINTTEWFFPKLPLTWLIDEFELQLPNEIDFENEVRNSERMNDLLRKKFSNVRTPKVIHELSSKHIITMEYVDGVKINDKRGLKRLDADPAYVCKLLTEVYSEQIFRWGFVHCDPHPGNIIIRRRTDGWWSSLEMVLLDHGLYQTVDDEYQKDYAELWRSIVFRDEKGIHRIANKFGVQRYELFAMIMTSRRWDTSDIGMAQTVTVTEKDRRAAQEFGQLYFTDITQVLSEVNRKMLLLLKCNDLLRGLQTDLGIPMNYFVVFAKYAMQALCSYDLKKNPTLFQWMRSKLRYARFTLQLWLYLWLAALQNQWNEAKNALTTTMTNKSRGNPKRVVVVKS